MQKSNSRILFLASTVIISVLSVNDAGACSTCGCSLNTDWQSLDYSFKPGLKVDLRYDFLDQNQLRSGTGTISPVAASQIVNYNGNQEVEKYTLNNYVTLGVDYTPNQDWGINFQLPYIVRTHSTLGTESDGITPGPNGGSYGSRTASIGDMRIIGRYQGLTSNHNVGVLLGLKLPTGSYTDYGVSTDPASPGSPAPIDRGLQPGTGTMDMIIGCYYNDSFGPSWGYFTQLQYQLPFDSAAGYRPGNILRASVGLRYAGFDYIAPQVQFNFNELQRDTGPNADHISTGGTNLYISPGLVAKLNSKTSMYAFVQVPLYQYVNGVQLAPTYTVTTGVKYSF